jgi:acetyltransferase-like isoleucine patch superfamily enzyme
LKKLRGSAVKNSEIHSTSKIEAGSLVVDSILGKYSFCGYDCEIISCEIGSFCSISNRVVIGGGMHPLDWIGMSPVFYEGRDSINKKFAELPRPEHKKTIIGNDVWIGHGAYIKAGIKIGDGSVIGMGSVVTKDVIPYSIVAGNPARLIRMRFEPEIVRELLKIEWWNFNDETLSKYAQLVNSPSNFIIEFQK